MKTVAIVPAAGWGKRLKSKIKKPFFPLGGKPLVSYALRALENSAAVDSIVVAVERSAIPRFGRLVQRYRFKKIIAVVAGGATRAQSVRNCLKAVGPEFGIVLIHDGARPFIESSIISDAVRAAKKFGAAVVAIPEIDTVKLVGKSGFIKRTLDRQAVCRAQTPQAFRRDLILRAYGRIKDAATDDAALVEKLGSTVKLVPGSYRNIKITTREDLKIAEVLL